MMDKDLLFEEAMKLYCAYMVNPANANIIQNSYGKEQLFNVCIIEVQTYYNSLQDNH